MAVLVDGISREMLIGVLALNWNSAILVAEVFSLLVIEILGYETNITGYEVMSMPTLASFTGCQ